MIIGSWCFELPVEFALGFLNFDVVDARVPARHQAVIIEFPILVAVGAIPLASLRLPLVAVTHRNPILGISPQLFDQPVVQLA